MLFNEFCECTGDLSTSTETKVKKYKTEHFGAKQNRKTKTETSLIDRGIAADRSAGVAKMRNKKAENLPIDRGSSTDRSAEV